MSPMQLKMKAEFARGQQKTIWMNELKGPLDVPEVKKIEEVCSVLWERKGKRLRSQWVFWFGEACGISSKELNLYAWAVEAIHTATLLHDDVIDRAPWRRGGPSANQLFDNTLPILSGDYLLSDAIFQLAERGHSFLVKSMCLAVKEVTQGEALQYEQCFRFPHGPDYFKQLNRQKTSALLHWASQVGSVLSTGKEDPRITELALHYGALYQFTDDLLDIRGTATKQSWQDLREGKINEATFLLANLYPDLKNELEKELSKRQITPDLLLKFQKQAKTRVYTELLERELMQRREDALKSVQWIAHPQLRDVLEHLIRFTVERLS